MTTKPHTCYAVFDAAENPIWYTCWATAARRGYTVRKLRMTEEK